MTTLILREIGLFAVRFALCFFVCAFCIKGFSQFTYGSDAPKNGSSYVQHESNGFRSAMTNR